MQPIVSVENVSKKYSRNANAHLSYGLADLLRELFGRTSTVSLRKDEFMAVEDVSFTLNAGDSIALVGRNGSGKTTLLKMMNGLVKPDAGRIVVEGRVQALINLGAGFNPNLAGLDNIYNSASLMGLTSAETKAIVDEVIEFAELEEFIDSPVGTYSSGMKARLGFSVAVHLRPDVLLIDEILSVGDHAFQNKCFIKIQELKKRGVTVVLVSHTHGKVIQVCERAIWLHRGKVMATGPAKQTVHEYLQFLEEEEIERARRVNASEDAPRVAVTNPKRGASPDAAGGDTGAADRATKAKPVATTAKKKDETSLYHSIYDEFDRIDDLDVQLIVDGTESESVRLHGEVVIRYKFRLLQRVTDLNVSLVIYRKDGAQIAAISSLNGDLLKDVHEGVVRGEVRIPDFNLAPGSYVLVMPVQEGKSYLYRNVVKEFVVKRPDRLAWGMADLNYEYSVEASTHSQTYRSTD